VERDGADCEAGGTTPEGADEDSAATYAIDDEEGNALVEELRELSLVMLGKGGGAYGHDKVCTGNNETDGCRVLEADTLEDGGGEIHQ
jgi:hypothetical protein